MPTSPFRSSCAVAGCPEPVRYRGRCRTHGAQADRLRGLSSDRIHTELYASPRWRKLRVWLLARYPLCGCDECRQLGRVHASRVLHHRKPHNGNPELFFDERNLLAVAKVCHDRITGKSLRSHEIRGVNSRPTRDRIYRVAVSRASRPVIATGGIE
jgi:5-methylcytosine-specific restriction protein A